MVGALVLGRGRAGGWLDTDSRLGGDQLPLAANSQLAEHAGGVRARCLDADAQLSGDLRVRPAETQVLQDLGLTRGEGRAEWRLLFAWRICGQPFDAPSISSRSSLTRLFIA
jgi:hypothetical protein